MLDFYHYAQRPTTAQVWCRFFNLGWEYWHPQILMSITKGIGSLLKIDRATLDGDFVHFARILIDVDLSKNLQESIILERDGNNFLLTSNTKICQTFARIVSQWVMPSSIAVSLNRFKLPL